MEQEGLPNLLAVYEELQGGRRRIRRMRHSPEREPVQTQTSGRNLWDGARARTAVHVTSRVWLLCMQAKALHH